MTLLRMKFEWKPKKQEEASLRKETLWLYRQRKQTAFVSRPWGRPLLSGLHQSFFPLTGEMRESCFYFILIDGAPCYVMWQCCIHSCKDKWWNDKGSSDVKWSATTGRGVLERELLPWTSAGEWMAGVPVEIINSFTGIACLLATHPGREDSIWSFLFLMCLCISLVVLGLSGYMQDLYSSLWRMGSLFCCSIWNLVPLQGLNPGPQHWEQAVLATELPGRSQHVVLISLK